MTSHSALKYRPDIDGLRAVAVLLVVLNHYRLHCTGGYVGVDVFFVISGYLIGASVIAEVQQGRFRLVDFYERRVRRIFPALLVMLGISTVAAFWVLTPSGLVEYSRSLVGAVLSFSNMLFWSEAGYFDTQSEAKPLLHTWSLAVEEQFYVFFPLFVTAMVAWRRTHLKLSLWIVAAASLAFAVAYTTSNPTAAFFFAPLRAWELLIGVLLSQTSTDWLRSRIARETVAALGLAMILVPALIYNSATAFPGLAALAPCLGAALLIGSGEQGKSSVAWLLSLRPVTYIGLISYSLYLWHWPLFVFQNTGVLFAELDPRDRVTRLLMVTLSILLATVSWRFVETPFRKGKLRPRRTPLFIGSGLAVMLLVVVAVATVHAKGYPLRGSGTSAQVARYQKVTSYMTMGTSLTAWRRGECFIEPKDSPSTFNVSRCLAAVTGKKQYLLAGDSLAAQLYPGLADAYPEWNLMQATSAMCTPYATPSGMEPAYLSNCVVVLNLLHQKYSTTNTPMVVLLAGDWNEKYLDGLGKQIAQIKASGNKAVVFGPPLAFDTSLPQLLSTEIRLKKDGKDVQGFLTRHFTFNFALDRKMSSLAKNTWKVGYVSYFDVLCKAPKMVSASEEWKTESGCPVFASPDVPLLFDNHHLTVEGSKVMAHGLQRTDLLQ